MLRLHRVWLSLPALCAGLLLLPSSARAVDTKLLPSDTEWVFSVNVKQIKESGLVQDHKDAVEWLIAQAKSKIPADEGRDKFLKAIGFDLRKDLDSVCVAGPAASNPAEFTLFVKGNFDDDKINELAQQFAASKGDKLRISEVGGAKIYEISVPDEKVIYATLITGDILVASATKDNVTGVITRSKGGQKASLKKELRNLLETVNNKQSVSFVATGKALSKAIENAKNVPNAEQVSGALEQIEGLSGAVTLSKLVEFQLAVNAKDDETAQKMSQGAQFMVGVFKGMAEQKAKEDPKAQIAVDVMKTLQVTSEGSNIIVRGELSVDVLERVFKHLPKE